MNVLVPNSRQNMISYSSEFLTDGGIGPNNEANSALGLACFACLACLLFFMTF